MALTDNVLRVARGWVNPGNDLPVTFKINPKAKQVSAGISRQADDAAGSDDFVLFRENLDVIP